MYPTQLFGPHDLQGVAFIRTGQRARGGAARSRPVSDDPHWTNGTRHKTASLRVHAFERWATLVDLHVYPLDGGLRGDYMSTPKQIRPALLGSRRSKSDPRTQDGSHRSSDRWRPPVSQAGLVLVLEPVALAADLHDVRVVQQPVEHCCGRGQVVGECGGPLREQQVAGQHYRVALAACGQEVEDQVACQVWPLWMSGISLTTTFSD